MMTAFRDLPNAEYEGLRPVKPTSGRCVHARPLESP